MLHKDEKIIVLILMLTQVMNMVDGVLIMPLGPLLMRDLQITSSEFSSMLSVYTIFAGTSGIITAFIINFFERKKLFLTLCIGFFLGNVFCGLSHTLMTLTIARGFTGIFGGALSGAIWVVVSEIIPASRRGEAYGKIASGFSIASVIGIPIGIYVANIANWETSFFSIAVLCVTIIILLIKYFPHLDSPHLERKNELLFDALKTLLHHKGVVGLVFTATVMASGFFIIPVLSLYMVKNVGISESDLAFVYFFGGLATIFTSKRVGRACDKFGSRKIFIISAILLIPILLGMTMMPPLPLFAVLLSSTVMMVVFNGRFVSSITLTTSEIPHELRNSFLNFATSVQNITIGINSYIIGLILIEDPGTGKFINFPTLGWLAVVSTVIAIGLSFILTHKTAEQ